MNWQGHSSREEVQASGILDRKAQQQHENGCDSSPRLKIQTCSQCHGHRIEKVLYNFMVLDRTCSKCDGEGVCQR
ncbi:Heat shock protein DnaJ, cysteine-rich domain [Plasmopara halstedii]|uniref:Heat shock protein DnaJ, cysteine-rich domain n=1 Tax=Plasmopara halstedii TaxID=4781 RepID=A0A0P1AZ24_PLAHL|nr:Heat shock protein DnaJ, cysteine-rich domain [Plasmopara halstedii]CEG46568.1 Heat shock protein DnaJ, cysteine-rich domain [Plasmopara halstedii]|eukprot:XP_024582937.1 Heat shock protein DnaJ, cysteine-rich domain [Plasmopara halstedii]